LKRSIDMTFLMCMLIFRTGCSCEGNFVIESPDAQDSEGETDLAIDGLDTPREDTEARDEVAVEDGDMDSPPDRDEITPEIIPEAEEEPPPGCTGEAAYLHGDLWPMWYNMRVACDPEHRALWRCERIHGEGAAECRSLQDHYEECIGTYGSPWPCINWGVCAPIEGTVCGVGDPPEECDTTAYDYDSDELWGSYYGLQWGSHTDLHRFLTIHVRNASGDLIIALSARPGSDEAYMGGLDNFGIGTDPAGFIQIIRDTRPEKFTDKFGTFACIRLPAGEELTLWAAWMNEFCHTCAEDYESHPDTPCWTRDITMSFEAGRHYLWTERGIELMDGCSGPPPEIAARLPDAGCSTVSP
jgi:hypothetical protein